MKKLIFIALFALLLFGLGQEAKAVVVVNSSTPLFIITANQCINVTYSDWSPCYTGFNIQIRQIVEVSNPSCAWSTSQQVERLRSCDSREFFLR
jgi:hypothetical protein